MYEMAKKAREAMRGKAKRLSGEKDSKTDSSDWSPAEPLDSKVKTGMRPISKSGYKKGGKVEGEKGITHAGRKPRKAGGRAITADSLINRDQKEANESREGKKHIGGLKTGGRTGKAMGGQPAPMDPRMLAMLKAKAMAAKGMPAGRGMPMAAPAGNMPPMKKGGKIKKAGGGTLERIKEPNPSPDYSPKTDPDYKPPAADKPSDEDRAKLDEMTRKRGGRTARKAGGNVNYGPQEMPGGKKGVSTKDQIKIEKHDQDLSKPSRGKAGHYADGGMPDPRMGIVSKNAMNFGRGPSGSPYKKGGMTKFEGSAKDEAQDKKLAKKHGMSMKEWEASKMDAKHDKQESMKGLKTGGMPKRTAKFGGGALSDLNMGPAKAAGGSTKAKGKTNINIMINPGAKPDQGAGMPGMPPSMPPAGPGGIPVPMGMPPAGGAPPAPMPMPMPMPAMPSPGGGAPMGRKAGGKVYKTYKDMDAGAGSGLGRLEKTEIAKRKA